MGDRQTAARNRVLYGERFRVKMSDGSDSVCEVIYQIGMTFHAAESGEQTFFGGDSRACHFSTTDSRINRTAILTKRDGSKVDLGSSTIAVPPPASVDYGNNCNRHLVDTDDFTPYQEGGLGSKATWDSYINDDLTRVENILSLIGAITSRDAI